MLLKRVDLGGQVLDVRFTDVVQQLGDLVPEVGEDVVDGLGGALLPGLHDHHLHLLAVAAADSSVDVSGGLGSLSTLAGTGWIRAVGWTEDGDRHDLDAVRRDRPVRVQHSSGALWVLNSAALDLIGEAELPGFERDPQGQPTGRLWRLDSWLAERVGRTCPDVAAVAERLLSLGITGVTDATPDLDRTTCALLRREVPLDLQLLGDPAGDGPVKLVLPDHDLPALDELIGRLAALRPRPVAVHCVTRASLVLLLTALDAVGVDPRDRIEHAAVVPRELRALPCSVVTQPAFLLDRGDRYLATVAAKDLPDLYRFRSLDCPVVPSSDAPYGPLDPWLTLRAARDRRSRKGQVLGDAESVPVAQALDGMLRPLRDLRAPARQVRPGAPADLVLLHVPLAVALDDPEASLVRATFLKGSTNSSLI
ncbi:MAG: nfdA 3 [Frankiales bacterium]|nr:nfdA 3 [Frankiales bacterium]